MTNKVFFSTVLVGIFSSLFYCPTSSLDLEDVKDRKCIQPYPQVARNIDFEWMYGVSLWYVPLLSKLHLYRWAESLQGIPLDLLTEDDVDLSMTCMRYRMATPNPLLFGYDGSKNTTFMVTMILQNSFGFRGTSDIDKGGRIYMTLRDNKSFIFFTNCWADGEASWNVISTTPTLTEEAMKNITEHATSLGFNLDMMVSQDYQNCPSLDVEKLLGGKKAEL